MSDLLKFTVRWRAYLQTPTGPVLIGLGKDVFHASTQARALAMAARRIPHRISAPEAEIGFRKVTQDV